MNKEELNDKKSMREFNKMMADMRHDLNKEHHWDERAKAQDKHWQWQKGFWILLMTVALWGIFTSPYFSPPEKTTTDNQKTEVKK